MTDTIIQQVSEQVKKAHEASSSARPLPRFEYVPTPGCEPSHRHAPVVSQRHSEGMREAPHANKGGRTREENQDRSIGVNTQHSHRPSHRGPTELTMPGLRSKSRPRGLEVKPLKDGGPQSEHEPTWPEPQDKECSTEIITTITDGNAEGITRSTWKAQLRGAQQEVNPTGIICLPLRFGDKVKARNLEVDFLVVDVPTTYNVILGRPTLHIIKQRVSKKRPKALSVRILIIIATLSRPGCIALLVRHHSLAVHGCSLLIAQALFNSCRRIKLHQLRVSTFGLDTTAILDELNIRLKIAFNVEGLRCQGHQELLKELGALITPPMIAPILDLGISASASALERASSSWPPSPSSTSRSDTCTWLPLHPTFGAQPEGRQFAPAVAHPSSQGRESNPPDANDHDLANFSTKVRLAEASAARKSACGARVCTEGSPAACNEDPCSPWDPPVADDPRPLLEAGRPADRGYRSTSSTALHLDREALTLRGGRSSILLILRLRFFAGTKLGEVQESHHRFLTTRATKKNNRGISIRAFLACISTRLRRSSSQTRSASVATCSTVASPYSRGDSLPVLALHKAKESQVRAKRRTYGQEGRQVPLENFLRISRPTTTKKKSLAKYFNLGSQFIGSLSLDVLRFHSSPFWASTTQAIKEGIGLG
ncbi:hypothetical protein Cgig2_013837 [Carnegiea gigantea]|uniref:Uncharacterized protein n=1 Tax=Carnegiea gigantea TaxID=171969 RepID=A0A9Q1GPE3_9CARY|nr:hypothetical protein Cgig2_013837 [Carnegiea gigantea]